MYFPEVWMQVSSVCSMVEYKPLTLNRWYVYPDWAYALGWLLALSSLLLVPGWALSRTCAGKGSLKQFHSIVLNEILMDSETPPMWMRAGQSSCDGREVKALDSKSNGVSPRRFESCSQRNWIGSKFILMNVCASPLPPAPIRTLEYSLITAALRGGYKAPVMDQCLGD
ncbi:hypothetical protein Q8A67_013472 [Cirrhinus molitorella]|uniref:Uncharacterized protein n=1 Tax=Cirrhinus molitorella TaxID=172907 RepID=A0AA88TJ39_9TELE|nr:hypothetical protein Q8A67_013472 [Cirrhinus molitorella]